MKIYGTIVLNAWYREIIRGGDASNYRRIGEKACVLCIATCQPMQLRDELLPTKGVCPAANQTALALGNT
jgi:hypothetical protein